MMNRTIRNCPRSQVQDHLLDQALQEVIEEFEENYGVDQFTYPHLGGSFGLEPIYIKNSNKLSLSKNIIPIF